MKKKSRDEEKSEEKAILARLFRARQAYVRELKAYQRFNLKRAKQ